MKTSCSIPSFDLLQPNSTSNSLILRFCLSVRIDPAMVSGRLPFPLLHPTMEGDLQGRAIALVDRGTKRPSSDLSTHTMAAIKRTKDKRMP